MNRVISSVFFILTCFFSLVSGQQNDKKSINGIRSGANAEPFKIAPGRSFSASTPKTDSSANFRLSENAQQIGRRIAIQDFSEALDVIQGNHIDGKRIDLNDLTKTSIDSMLHALDPHSNYFDAGEYGELLADEQSEYTGIGASITNYVQNGVSETFITSAFPDSPAYRAGFRFGDKIIAVDGENMINKNSFYVRQKIRGAKGTAVRLVVERSANGKIETLEIKRNIVPQPSIPDAYLLRPGIAYIDLSRGFTYTTSDELEAALKDLREQGMSSLVLDLRDNPGGILEQAVKVAEKFLPPGQVVVSQRGRTEIDNRKWLSSYKNPENIPLVVLVNTFSASASEIVSGAFQDYDRALIIGEKTFGKGLVQTVLNLPYGSGLTLTTARYYTPSGRSIQRDYAKGNLYDYYQHKTDSSHPKSVDTRKTLTGRRVCGGDGIEPDEIVKSPALNTVQIKLLDPLFFFSRDVVTGKVIGLENYKITRPVQYGQRLRLSDFPAGEDLFKAFKDYLSLNHFHSNISREQVEMNQKFILTRLRFHLATAAFGSVAANQILIENDPQVGKAVDALPRAQLLALSAKRTLQRR
jgi:carboxyl-terminal processing protease